MIPVSAVPGDTPTRQANSLDEARDTFHIETCHDENLALCGTDITFDEYLTNPRPTDLICVVCEQLDAVDCADSHGYCTCLCCSDALERLR